MIHAVTFSDFARRYSESRDISPVYAATLRRRAKALEDFCGETVIGMVLTESNVNDFLGSLGRLSPWTVRGYRSDLVTLWLSAADEALVGYPVTRRIRRPKCGELLVECYTIEEARALLDAAKNTRGVYPGGAGRADYWQAAILAAWDSGLRRGDIWALNRNNIRPDGSARVIQHKTGRLITVHFRPPTIAALDRISKASPLDWPLTPSRFGRHFKRLVRASGVGRGTFKFLRRSSGSYVEAAQPGAGHKHLGNGAVVFSKHYDARLGTVNRPLPPELA